MHKRLYYLNLIDAQLNTQKDSEFVFDSSHNSSINFDNNKINMGDFTFNPYLEKIENLEEMYREGKFDKQIKANLINLELENDIAPKFMTELIKINDFLKDKKSVNILLKDCEKTKVDPHISYILELRENSIELDLGYNAEKEFEKANPNKNIADLKLEDLQGLSYGKQVLEINPDNLMDLRKQIAINPEDKLLFKIDELKEKLEDKFRKYGNVSDNEMLRTYNMGVGLAMVIPEEKVNQVKNHIQNKGINCYEIGKIVKGNKKVITYNNLNW